MIDMETKVGLSANRQKWNLTDKCLKICTLQNFAAILGGLVICVILGKIIINADTVWELADEAGYLSNAAYFLGYDWGDSRAIMPYYAYGYSVFLIPVFLMANTGVDLIRGAMFVNLFFAIGTYCIIIYLLEKVWKQENRLFASAISFIVCLNSYLCCNVLKVDCEPLSVFWYCLTAVILYKALERENKSWFITLGATAAYLFFIHTRMLALIFALIVALLITFWVYDKKKEIVGLVYFGMAFAFCFAILYLIKRSIVDYADALSGAKDITHGNLIDNDYIINRIKWLFMLENLKFYAFSLLSKIYYSIIVSAGTIFFGYAYLLKDILSARTRGEGIQSYAVKLFIALGMALMIIVCTLNGAGMLEDFRYFFYSRYYENAIIPMIAVSVLGTVTVKWSKKVYFVFLIMEIGIGIAVSMLKEYLYSGDIRVDTARIPGFSWLVDNNDSFQKMVLWGTAVIVLLVGIYFAFCTTKARAAVTLLAILVVTWKSASLGIEVIDGVHVRAKADAEIAEQISGKNDDVNVYMIDDASFKYQGYYIRMQVLLKDIPLKVIHKDKLDEIEDIPNETWVLTYKSTDIRDAYASNFKYVMTGDVFELWKK